MVFRAAAWGTAYVSSHPVVATTVVDCVFAEEVSRNFCLQLQKFFTTKAAEQTEVEVEAY